jgi:hypothetical protein
LILARFYTGFAWIGSLLYWFCLDWLAFIPVLLGLARFYTGFAWIGSLLYWFCLDWLAFIPVLLGLARL